MPTTRRKLIQKAATLLKLRRPQQSALRNGKVYHPPDEAQVVTSFSEPITSEEGPKLPPLRQPQSQTEGHTQVIGKRRRKPGRNMAITIHEDAAEVRLHKVVKMSAEERGLSRQSVDPFEHAAGETSESDEELDESVIDDMRKLEESFAGISSRYRLVNKIGEGTFSTVYKAEQLDAPDSEDTENIPVADDECDERSSKRRKHDISSSSTAVYRRKTKYVALKKIYVTSSPHRILNELELLHDLRGHPYICPLLTAFRHQDQIIAVLPYFRHLDFRLYYHKFHANDTRQYMYTLLKGLEYVHQHGIIHRDIKPTNFLYDTLTRRGQLVDFGLAERQGVDWQHCLCQEDKVKRKQRFMNSFATQEYQARGRDPAMGYPKHDNRPSRRANRAGTRGFRAPEVLFKCTAQTTKIDIWSVGVILLTIMGRRFPFFNSSDDIDATIEIGSIFGMSKMQGAAALHGQLLETTLPTIGEKGFNLEKIVRWASCRESKGKALHDGELQAVELLYCLVELDPHKRFSASEALEHEFFTDPDEDEYEKMIRETADADGAAILTEAMREEEEDDGEQDES